MERSQLVHALFRPFHNELSSPLIGHNHWREHPLGIYDLWANNNVHVNGERHVSALRMLAPTLCAKIDDEPVPRFRFLKFIAGVKRIGEFNFDLLLCMREADEEYFTLLMNELDANFTYFAGHDVFERRQAASIITAFKETRLHVVLETRSEVSIKCRVISLSFRARPTMEFAVIVQPPGEKHASRLGMFSVGNFEKGRMFHCSKGASEFVCGFFLEEPPLIDVYLRGFDRTLYKHMEPRVPSLFEQCIAPLLGSQDFAVAAALIGVKVVLNKREREMDQEERKRKGKIPRLDDFYD